MRASARDVPWDILQDLGTGYRNWQTDCAHLIQVVVYCDKLALQQLAARGRRACGQIANIPDDGAVELVALSPHHHTITHTNAHTQLQGRLARQQWGWKHSNRRWEWTRTMANLIAEANVWLEASVHGTRLLPVTSNAACRQHHADRNTVKPYIATSPNHFERLYLKAISVLMSCMLITCMTSHPNSLVSASRCCCCCGSGSL
jgi:hypothetical protein